MAISVSIPSSPSLKDLTNARFGRLTVVGFAEKRGRKLYWNCVCDCGASKAVHGEHLKEGRSRSCGCLNRDAQRDSFTTHGGAPFDKSARHPLYSTWCNMKKRCYSKKADQYPYYGGRGIVVCDEWKHDFARFAADMGLKPSPEHSIDRKDNDGPYALWNCRWATKVEQAANKRAYGTVAL